LVLSQNLNQSSQLHFERKEKEHSLWQQKTIEKSEMNNLTCIQPFLFVLN
jgi:hypothetical protein